jgi:uncharacterized Zn finger protein (UPF0148 family)
MTATANTFDIGTTKPDKMMTLTCRNCRMALYMSERELQMPTWQCPSCGTVTRTVVQPPAGPAASSRAERSSVRAATETEARRTPSM